MSAQHPPSPKNHSVFFSQIQPALQKLFLGCITVTWDLGCSMFITPLVLSSMNRSAWAEHSHVASRMCNSCRMSPMERMGVCPEQAEQKV